MDMRKIALIAGIVVVVAALVGLGIYFFGGKSGKGLSPEEVRRQNTLTLAKEYLEKGEYQRALDLLDGLLIENVNDEEAKALRDKTIDARRLAEETQKKQSEAKQDELVSSLSQLGDSIKDQARSQRAVSPEELRREELRREEEKKRLEEQRKLDEERRQEELKRLEEQKREAERRAEEEKARLEAMSKAEREKREKVVSLISEGVKSLSAQKYPEARDKFDEALSLDTNAAEAYAQKAEAFYQEDPENPENIQRAVDNANKAIEKDKNLWIPHKTLGKVYAQRRDYNNAVREYAEASRLNPTNDSILFELGKVQFRAGKFQDARMSFESSVHLNPKNEKAFFNLGAALRRLGDDELALKAYKTRSRQA
jgi:tetratricopeptide (TPR) repeat protein